MSHHREEFRVDGMAEPLSHYTDAVKAGGLLFVSGIVPLDAEGKLVGEGDFDAQVRQSFKNIARTLEAAGASLRDLVSATRYLTDVDEQDDLNRVWAEYLGGHLPTTTTVEVSRLATHPRCKLEISAIAVTDAR
jgi:reactive intermediate/imine deaminase